ncbi:hypothetical protein RCG17_23140 [Neobacillus sp. PS3-12]|uniref:hypothetical protein n=1 Tax=Neobacillus sp. PS3-12 TaxID=3070677 RepID=UPI0027DEF4D8|nr:hypothetical protein [Neobacillus sp. PS3-12]WML52249.1 hypothetical protein RCG17_23140 [Neobacillus sp. PS3-12]
MLSNILKALSEGEFSSDVLLSLDGIQINDDELSLTIQATYEDDDEKLQVWKVTCTDFRDHKLNVNYFEEFEVLDNHVFLWEYNNNSADLFFKGHCNDINKVMGELFLTHSNIVNGQLPLEKYININYHTKDLRHLLKQGEGLLTKGPINLIKAYEKVLLGNGYKTSIIEFPTKESSQYKIFIFGDSYVVAKDFQAFQVL